jgi:hypothetical protein
MLAPSPQPTQQQVPKNAITFADLLQTAADLGAEAGKGKDTQIKFLLKAVEGGYHNALDLAGNKHGTDVDDATKLAETYVKAQQGAVVFDAKAPNQRKLISTIRTGIKLGSWPKGGNGEPLATVNNLMTIRQNLKKIPAEAKKLDDAANTLMKYARTQLKRDQLIDDAELKEFCYKPGKDLATAEELIERMAKQLDKLVDGSASQSTAQDNSPEIRNARQALRQRLVAIAKARGLAKGNGAQP